MEKRKCKVKNPVGWRAGNTRKFASENDSFRILTTVPDPDDPDFRKKEVLAI